MGAILFSVSVLLHALIGMSVTRPASPEPTMTELPSSDHQWTGTELRSWAETLAARLDAGEVTLRIDFDRMQPDHDDWTLHVQREQA